MLKEQKSYLDNPEIRNAAENYNIASLMRIGGGLLPLPSVFVTLVGSLGLLERYWKKEQKTK